MHVQQVVDGLHFAFDARGAVVQVLDEHVPQLGHEVAEAHKGVSLGVIRSVEQSCVPKLGAAFAAVTNVTDTASAALVAPTPARRFLGQHEIQRAH